MQRRGRIMAIWARECLAALVVALAASCGPQPNTENKEQSATAKTRPAAAPIDPGVYEPYKREQGWEKTFARWGDEGVARIQRLREAAAATVARDPKCDAVELSEISDSRSTPPDSPMVYVDCTNGERFYLGESDVGSTVSSEMEKGAGFSSADLIRQCTDAVRARLNLPASFDQKIWSVSDRQGTSGNRVVEFDFEAKNYLGATLPAQARCIMTTQGQFEVTVIE